MHATAQRAGGGPPDPRMEYWRPTTESAGPLVHPLEAASMIYT